MKFLKNTVAIVALLTIVSANAKVMTKKVQPVVVTQNQINDSSKDKNNIKKLFKEK